MDSEERGLNLHSSGRGVGEHEASAKAKGGAGGFEGVSAGRHVVHEIGLAVDKPYFWYSKISPGWHSNALQIASNVDSRTALALPFFKMEMLAIVMPTFSVSSVTLIFRFANMTSMLIIIAMVVSLYR